MSLVVMPERRVLALRGVAEAATNLVGVQRALQAGRLPGISELGSWTWLRVFYGDDLRAFVDEIQDAVIVASREEAPEVLEGAIDAWRITAEQAADPIRDAILLGSHRREDFVEVARPE
jgi:hypothetical protein